MTDPRQQFRLLEILHLESTAFDCPQSWLCYPPGSQFHFAFSSLSYYRDLEMQIVSRLVTWGLASVATVSSLISGQGLSLLLFWFLSHWLREFLGQICILATTSPIRSLLLSCLTTFSSFQPSCIVFPTCSFMLSIFSSHLGSLLLHHTVQVKWGFEEWMCIQNPIAFEPLFLQVSPYVFVHTLFLSESSILHGLNPIQSPLVLHLPSRVTSCRFLVCKIQLDWHLCYFFPFISIFVAPSKRPSCFKKGSNIFCWSSWPQQDLIGIHWLPDWGYRANQGLDCFTRHEHQYGIP